MYSRSLKDLKKAMVRNSSSLGNGKVPASAD